MKIYERLSLLSGELGEACQIDAEFLRRLLEVPRTLMAVKKSARKKATTKSGAKRAVTQAKKTEKKVARRGKSLAKKAAAAASTVSHRTKKVARGAEKFGKIVSTIGNLVEAGGEAAEDLVVEVESRGRKASSKPRNTGGRAKKGVRKKR
ncbi:MAG: hypothetical protein WA215_00510 [Candidatus Cybelea sp.]